MDSDLVDVLLLEDAVDGPAYGKPVGTLRLSSAEAPDRPSDRATIALDTAARTFSVTGGNFGDIRTGTRDIRPGDNVVPGGTPRLLARMRSTDGNTGRRDRSLFYAFDTIAITALR